MKKLALISCSAVISALISFLIIELNKERNKEHIVIEQIIEVVETPYKFIYYSSTELNEEVQKIIEGGGSQDVLDFFTYYTDDALVSSAILEESLNQNVPITSSFSLAWGESRFKTSLTHRNGKSTSDWGLFQLNDGYRNWTKEEFFDVQKNTKEGINYFAYSLSTFNNDLTFAIAGYNKGVENVKNRSPVSYQTLTHISNIIEYDHMLEVSLNKFVNRWHNGR